MHPGFSTGCGGQIASPASQPLSDRACQVYPWSRNFPLTHGQIVLADSCRRKVTVSVLETWLGGGLRITDGAWGTELQARGLPPGTTPDSWNLTHPDLVEEVARAYAEAGSELILTNTFRANAIAMSGTSEADLDAINRAGVAISRRAAPQARVVASIGPTGKILMSGEVSSSEVSAAFRNQARSLAEAGADALIVETMSDIDEARLALEAARECGLPVLVSFAFDSGKDKDRTMMGATPEAVAGAMTDAGAAAVGANCGVGIERAVALCRRLHSATSLPIWIKPNAGLPTIDDGVLHYNTSADLFASHFGLLQDAGASFIGACCGSNPEFVRALVKRRNAH